MLAPVPGAPGSSHVQPISRRRWVGGDRHEARAAEHPVRWPPPRSRTAPRPPRRGCAAPPRPRPASRLRRSAARASTSTSPGRRPRRRARAGGALQRLEAHAAPDEHDGRHPAGGGCGRGGGLGAPPSRVELLTVGSYPPRSPEPDGARGPRVGGRGSRSRGACGLSRAGPARENTRLARGYPPQTAVPLRSEPPVTTFDELVHGLFADLFRASPVFATWLGNHDHDGAWPDQTEAGARAFVALVDRWTEAFAALPVDALTARRGDRPRHRRSASWPRPASMPRTCARRPGTRSSGSTCSATGSTCCWPASSRRSAVRLAVRRRADRGDPGRPRGGPRAPRRHRGPAGQPPAHRGRRWPAARDRGAVPGGPRRWPRPRTMRASLRRSGHASSRRSPPPRRPRRLRGAPPRRRPPGGRGRRPPGPRAVFAGEAAPHARGRTSPPTSSRRAPGASSRPSAPRWSASPAGCGRGLRPDEPCRTIDGTLVRGALDTIAARAPGARRACSTSAAPSWSASRTFCRERDLIGLAGRAARDRLDAGLPARLRRGRCSISPGPLDRGLRATST